MFFKFFDGGIQPDGLAQIKFIADGIQRVEYFMRAGVLGIIADDGIPEHSVVFKFFSP